MTFLDFHSHTVRLLVGQTVTLLDFLNIRLSYFHTVERSNCLILRLSDFQTVWLSDCQILESWTIRLSNCQTDSV